MSVTAVSMSRWTGRAFAVAAVTCGFELFYFDLASLFFEASALQIPLRAVLASDMNLPAPHFGSRKR